MTLAFKLSTTGRGVSVSVGRGVKVNVTVALGCIAVSVSVAGTLVDVLLTVGVGRTVCPGLERLQDSMLRIRRAKRGRYLFFTS